MTDEAHTLNPFVDITPADLEILARVEHHFIVSTPSRAEPIEALVGRALLSAVLFGGLNDPGCWSRWLTAATKARSIQSHEMMWWLEGEGEAKAKAIWYPDPITGCYLGALRSRFEVSRAIQTIGKPLDLLRATLRALAEGAPDVGQLQTAASNGPIWLNDVCAARLHLRIPGMLAEHAKGRTRTSARTSLPPASDDKLAQLERFLETAEPFRLWIPRFNDAGLRILRPAFFPSSKEKTSDSLKLSRARMLKSLEEQIGEWSKPWWKNSIHLHMLLWLKLRIDTRTRSELPCQTHIRPSTARKYLWVLSTHNWSKNRALSVMNADGAAELEKAFKKFAENSATGPPSQRSWFGAVLHSFSIYLHAQNPAIQIWPSNAASEQGSRLPRRTVLRHEDFMQLLDLLDRWGALPIPAAHSGTDAPKTAELKNAKRAEACKLAAMLMFRTGLRGQEVSNLALNDISFEGDFAELVVRGSATRPNKNRFARRTLPLHALLGTAEFDQLRRLHTVRCNEEFRLAPRARLFPFAGSGGLSIEQYLLEPVDAAIRLLFEDRSLGKWTRKRNGYWYSLASPLRHSFASHLIACLSLPDEPMPLPAPPGLTPDLVSLERKTKLCNALLRSQHHGLAIMQAVRYVMGHASYTRALETYIHNVDWLLAVQLWRSVHQPPMTAQEVGSLLKLGAAEADDRPLRSDRHMRRVIAKAASNHSAPSALPQMRRGRPPLALGEGENIRSLSAKYRAFLPDELPDTVFGNSERLADKGGPVCEASADPELDKEWLTIHNFLRLRTKKVAPAEAAQQLWLKEEVCQRWAKRADELAAITKRARGHKSSSSPIGTEPELRFSQLKLSDIEDPRSEAPKQHKAGGFPNPRGAAAKLIDHIWSQRAQIGKPQRWASVLSLLANWQSEPPIMRSQRSVERLAKTYLRLGIPPTFLGVRVANGPWETYDPCAPVGGGDSTVFQLSPLEPCDEGAFRGLHNTFLYALLLVLIASDNDFGSLKSSSTSQKRERLPEKLRPRRLAKVVVTLLEPETVVAPA